MSFADKLKKLDAHRLQQSVKATVQSNGRLTFTVEATKKMGLSAERSLIVFEAENGDLGATISQQGDPDAFELKKCGQYFYVAFKNYLQQAGIEYKSQRIIYDITELDEKLDGRVLYKFERRIIPRLPEQAPTAAAVESGGTGDDPDAVGGAGNADGAGPDEPPPPLDDELPPESPDLPDDPEPSAAPPESDSREQ